MNHTDAFDEMLAEQPSDWSFFEVYVTLDDPLRLAEARVALARGNARPVRVAADHDFEITGRTWAGATRTLVRPAPPHRYGP